jgi:hypothetical protein
MAILGAATIVSVCLLLSVITSVQCDRFDHAVDMDENYRLLWSINNQEITFEVQARTLGYVGLGFSRDGTIYGADIVIGWVNNGQVHFQVSTNIIACLCFIFLLVHTIKSAGEAKKSVPGPRLVGT